MSDYPTCETCEHRLNVSGDMDVCERLSDSDWGDRQKPPARSMGHHGYESDFIIYDPQNFGCTLHSDLEDEVTDERTK